MIALVNLGPAPGNRRRGCKTQPLNPLGPHLYHLKINHTPVAIVTHTRSEPLSTLLEKAADAARLQESLQQVRHTLPSAS